MCRAVKLVVVLCKRTMLVEHIAAKVNLMAQKGGVSFVFLNLICVALPLNKLFNLLNICA